jgi:outer membrane receptor protein involved in Fe transport
MKGVVFGDWSWDAHYSHGQTDGSAIVNTNIVEANYLEATYVVTGANGVPVCGPVATNPNLTAARAAQVLPGCQPFNVFGLGMQSQAALNYIKAQSDTETVYKQDVVAANLRGDPFSTWAGPVAVAVGAEHRRETGNSQTTPLGAELAFLSNNGVTYSGLYRVTEGYLETGVPLAKDLPWARSLDFNAAVRETDYSTSGSVTTWKGGLTYEPVDSIRFRFTRSRDIRAPSIAELYSARTSGITATFLNPITGQTGPEYTIGGGNPNLKPEVANSYTGGVVFQPRGGPLAALVASVDYYNVSIRDVITTVAASDIANRCAEGLTDYCAYVSTASGSLEISSIPVNLQRLTTSGVDVEIVYPVPIDALHVPGRLDVRSLSTWVEHLTTTDTFSSTNRAGSGANGGVPTVTSNLDFTYSVGNLSNLLELRYTSPIKGDATLIGPGQPGYNPALSNSINMNLFPSALYLNWAGQYELPSSGQRELQVFAGINNLANKQPPFGAIIAFASGGNPYDVIGRTFKVGFRMKL